MFTQKTIFPFSAILGQDHLSLALILNAIYPQIGGVLIQGERGTAKSTAARGLGSLLPPIMVIDGCRFGCNPLNKRLYCSDCQKRYSAGTIPPSHWIPTPFVNLPVAATEDRVVGSLDIEKAIKEGKRYFQPGILAAANRGILYIDEVNLLDDHLLDLLLDAAAMGINIVEREGISFSHPAHFILIGTMNPEEGSLRPQLLDRFGLSVHVQGVREINQRMRILERCLEFEDHPNRFYQIWEQREKEINQKICHARQNLHRVKHTIQDLQTIAEISTNAGIEGHRADMVMLKTAKANAALQNRSNLIPQDILLAAQFALPHRIKKSHFQAAFEIPEPVFETIYHQVYPDKKARLESILNDRRDHTEIEDLANEFGFYIVG